MNECYGGTQTRLGYILCVVKRDMYLRATGDYLEKPSFSYSHWISLSNEFGLRGFVSRSLHELANSSERASKE